MKFSRQMKAIIEKIAAKHGVDVYQPGVHLRLEMEGYMPLVIENVGAGQISVTHYYEQNGDLVCDPDIVFFVEGGEWVPIEITQVFGYQRVAILSPDGTRVASFYPRAQASVNALANQWAKNIKDQSWLEEGVRANAEKA